MKREERVKGRDGKLLRRRYKKERKGRERRVGNEILKLLSLL